MTSRKKVKDTTPLASSRLVSMVERAIENGAAIGGVIYMTPDGSVGYQFTEEASPEQISYMMRFAELRFMMGSVIEEDGEEDFE